MIYKSFCKSCRIPTRQLCVKSRSFQNVEANVLQEQFQEWNGVLHVCKRKEHDCAFVHFASDVLASVCYHRRSNATINGKRVQILPVYKDQRPVHYAQPPLSFPPIPPPSTSASEPQQQQQQQQQPQ
ncbi:hypothetical protein INT45_013188 [Circinella minor]|uniref:RRM domain-containing protein n=1 Tax=Circinella minor TaxID=1195481 RepID=A0A8H7RQ91_9FUNG|nr:hypothetical protein INT45_013188 [Circinella minor]